MPLSGLLRDLGFVLAVDQGLNQREAMAGAQTRPMRLTSLMKLRLVI